MVTIILPPVTLEPDPDNAGVGKGNMFTKSCHKLIPLLAISILMNWWESTKAPIADPSNADAQFSNLPNHEGIHFLNVNGESFRFDTTSSAI
jgi:hypothetical protein